MFDQQPTLELLFDQLGLPSDSASIDEFVLQRKFDIALCTIDADAN